MGKYLQFRGGGFATPSALESVVSQRDEMRKLIDLIERGVMGASVQQNVEDMRLFASTASFIANKLDVKLKQKTRKPKAHQVAPSVPKPRSPKTAKTANNQQQSNAAQSGMPSATGTATSSKDFGRVRSVQPQVPLSPNSIL
jgi:hypothetical protein